MVKEVENALPKIGYVFHYPRIDEPTDKFRLDIFISTIATERHFDVLRCQVFVKNQEGIIEVLTVSHPWVFEKEADVCAGIVILEDRKGKKEEAFTFGGKLKIIEQGLQTICVLTSPAPILDISGATPLHILFIEELEIIFAKRQAAFLDHFNYEAHLCRLDPFELYRACLRSLIEEFEDFPHKDQEYHQLLMYLHSQEYRLSAAGLTNTPSPTIDEIFEK